MFFLPSLSKAVLFFIFITSLLDLRDNVKITILLITVVVLPFINWLLVLDSAALSHHSASIPKQR